MDRLELNCHGIKNAKSRRVYFLILLIGDAMSILNAFRASVPCRKILNVVSHFWYNEFAIAIPFVTTKTCNEEM